jgi:hypothetical protein
MLPRLLTSYQRWSDIVLFGFDTAKHSEEQLAEVADLKWMDSVPLGDRRWVWDQVFQDDPQQELDLRSCVSLELGELVYRLGVAHFLGRRFLMFRVSSKQASTPFLILGVKREFVNGGLLPCYSLVEGKDTHLRLPDAVRRWHDHIGGKLSETQDSLETLLTQKPRTWFYFTKGGKTNALFPGFYSL